MQFFDELVLDPLFLLGGLDELQEPVGLGLGLFGFLLSVGEVLLQLLLICSSGRRGVASLHINSVG